jgi:hypothetical protein
MSRLSDLLSWGNQEIGKPYVYGAEGPNTFDCSGLMQYIFAKVGISLPRVADAQYRATTRVASPSAGDLVFYVNDRTGVADHVALYLGGGKMLAAPHTGANVEIQSVYTRPGWTRAYGRVAGLGVAGGSAIDTVASVATQTVGWTSDQISGLLGGARGIALEGILALAGLSLIGVGLYRLAKPRIDAKTSELENLL